MASTFCLGLFAPRVHSVFGLLLCCGVADCFWQGGKGGTVEAKRLLKIMEEVMRISDHALERFILRDHNERLKRMLDEIL